MTNSMKIIVATDFTDASNNAVNYIHQAFNSTNFDIQLSYLLVHAFKPLAPYSNTPSLPVMENDAMEVQLRKQLDNLQKDMASKVGTIDRVGRWFAIGSLNNVLEEIIEETPAQLIVMGSRPKSAFARMTIGSNTLEVSNTVDCPLLAVPEGTNIQPLSKIVLATALNDQSLSRRSIELLGQLTSSGNIDLEVVHIKDDNRPQDDHEMINTSAIHHQLSAISHSHQILAGDDVADELMNYVAQNQPDMIAMAPSEKSFFDKIFHQSKTEQMIYQEKIPTLLLT